MYTNTLTTFKGSIGRRSVGRSVSDLSLSDNNQIQVKIEKQRVRFYFWWRGGCYGSFLIFATEFVNVFYFKYGKGEINDTNCLAWNHVIGITPDQSISASISLFSRPLLNHIRRKRRQTKLQQYYILQCDYDFIYSLHPLYTTTVYKRPAVV